MAAAAMYGVPLIRPTRSGDWEDLRSYGGMSMRPGIQVHRTTVGREFTEALGVTVLRGDAFSDTTVAARQDIALVNATFARMFGGEIDLGGQNMQLTSWDNRSKPPGSRARSSESFRTWCSPN